MSASKEAMASISNMVAKSTDGHIPTEEELNAKPDEQQQQQQQKPDEQNTDDDAGFVNEAGDKVNEQGQLINDDGSLIDDGDDDGDLTDEEKAQKEKDAEAQFNDDESLYTPKQLAEAIEWPVEDIYSSLVIPMDDGAESIPLGEFKNVHQNLVRDHKALQDRFTEQGGALQTAQQGFNAGQQMSTEMQEAQSYLSSINRMEQATNWKELEDLDPTEAVLKRDKFRTAREEIMGQIQQIDGKQKMAQQYYLQQANVKMVELIPTWKDPKAQQADQDVMRTHMHTAGFNDNEIDHIVDPRVMFLMKELIDLRALKAQAGDAVKRVRNAPKVLKGGRNFRKPLNKVAQTKGLVEKAKQTGQKGDELNAVKSLLKNR